MCTTTITTEQKQKQARISEQIKAHLASGGKIKSVPFGVSAESGNQHKNRSQRAAQQYTERRLGLT